MVPSAMGCASLSAWVLTWVSYARTMRWTVCPEDAEYDRLRSPAASCWSPSRASARNILARSRPRSWVSSGVKSPRSSSACVTQVSLVSCKHSPCCPPRQTHFLGFALGRLLGGFPLARVPTRLLLGLTASWRAVWHAFRTVTAGDFALDWIHKASAVHPHCVPCTCPTWSTGKPHSHARAGMRTFNMQPIQRVVVLQPHGQPVNVGRGNVVVCNVQVDKGRVVLQVGAKSSNSPGLANRAQSIVPTTQTSKHKLG